jgi:hypothetical protein
MLRRETRERDLLHMPVIRAAAAAEHGEMRQLAAQFAVVLPELDRISHVKFRRGIEFRVAAL